MINDSTQTDLSKPPFDAFKGNLPYIFVSYSHKDSSMVFKEIVRLYHGTFFVGAFKKVGQRDEVVNDGFIVF